MIMSSPARVGLLALVTGLALAVGTFAQEPGNASATETKERQMDGASQPPKSEKGNAAAPTAAKGNNRVENLFVDFAQDQKDLWTSPKELRSEDASWLVPLSGLTAGLFVTDADYSRHISHDPNTLSHYDTLSNASLAALIGGAGGMWLLSHHTGNSHWRETGFLAGEATVHSLVMTEALKYSLRRERPYQGDGSGAFFQSSGTSFPSEHSAAAWSVAAILAHEYPGWLTKLLAYSGASLVSYSRIRAEKHFPSDVVVGALIGELAAHQVYTKHHDVELGGDSWTSPAHLFYDDGHSKPGYVGSPYVPLDSWIYPALDRLAAMGLVNNAFAGMRPWTRLACAQMIIEAQDRADAAGPVASELVDELQKEFQPELGGGADRGQTIARLESAYFRGENISGVPLTDGYTFAQTRINDFGRPYGEGFNSVTGFSTYATRGPWVGYVRGELQTAPTIPPYSLSTRQTIQQVNGYPQLPPDTSQPSVHQIRLLDAYIGLSFSNWQVSFGKQSLSWGLGDGGSLTLSNNAPPIDMIRFDRVTPMNIPLLSRIFGPMRMDLFFGQLTGQVFLLNPSGLVGQFGHTLSPQPFIHGQKISFKPTRNLEFGFFRTTVYGGPGYPLTFHTLIRSLFTTGNENLGGASKPGNRTAGMDLMYRLPFLRKWVTFYADGYTDDQLSPVAYADRSAWRAGLYLSQFPRVHKLDLRVEGVYTDVPPGGGPIAPGQFYFNGTWRSGYTNNGNLIGSWVGRGGQGAQAWADYWFSPRNRVQLNFRHQKVSQEFITGGGTLTDVGLRGDYRLRPNLAFSASVQYERWLFPVIQPGAERDLTASFQIQFQPQRIFRPSFHGGVLTGVDTGDPN